LAGAAHVETPMSRFFVSGLINLETTLAVEGFPIPYFPARYPFFGIQTAVSGVGFNITSALTVLGNRVDFAALIGSDDNAMLVRKALNENGMDDKLVKNAVSATAQSVILYDPQGRREIHVDLKDIQETNYPVQVAQAAIMECDLAVICNINFSRPLLQAAGEAGKRIATDVHALAGLGDEYNRDFMAAANILFLSDESLSDSPEQTARELIRLYNSQMVVIRMGEKGALLAYPQDDFVGRFPAVQVRPVVNTIGAGDALFSAFLDRFVKTDDPYRSLQAAMVFASYKIGEKGAAQGFLTGEALEDWLAKFDRLD